MDTIQKTKKGVPFVQVSRAIAQDENLSMQAKGMFLYLLSLPSDWIIHKRELYNHFTNGRDACEKAFNELIDYGVIYGADKISSDGKFSHKEWVVYYEPEPMTENQSMEENAKKPVTGKPLTENPPLHKKNNKEIKQINISFDLFWNAYDKKVDKKYCFNKWNKLSDKQRQDIMDYIPRYKLNTPDPKYRKNPKTFLNNESWKDEGIQTKTIKSYYDFVKPEMEGTERILAGKQYEEYKKSLSNG